MYLNDLKNVNENMIAIFFELCRDGGMGWIVSFANSATVIKAYEKKIDSLEKEKLIID